MPSPAVAVFDPARGLSIQPMLLSELSAAFSAAHSLLTILKNDDSQAGPLDKLSFELRELVVEAVDDWFLFGDGFECDRSWTNRTHTVVRANRRHGSFGSNRRRVTI